MRNIPPNPGCYLFKDPKDIVIYVGKANNLSKRVSSYFSKSHSDKKTQNLVKNIDSVDFIVTDNETEALILENNLIKKHQPRYNINLKDSKRYAFIQETLEDFPRLILARKVTKGKFYGPFVSASERDTIHKLVLRLFRLRTCKRMPKKPCLRYHINLCTAPCAGHVTKARYTQQVKQAGKVLTGHTRELVRDLEKKMRSESIKKEFERAIILRDQISSISYLSLKQKMERQKKYNENIINYIIKDDRVYLMLFHIYKGTLINKQEYVFNYKEGFLEEFILQYYSEHDVPKELILPENIDDSLHGFLEHMRAGRVSITVPKIADKKKLLELVHKNIEITFFGDMTKIEELQKKLNLQSPPTVIECFDISHLVGTSTVGSMVSFRNAKPDKSNYRRFKIRTVEIDDFRALAEVVRRRYKRLKEENREMPDLIIIDGGKGQLSFALNVLKRLHLSIPIISIAKREEEIFFPYSRFPLKLDRKEKALRFIQEIRDEAHRFAIKYNRLLRGKILKK